MASVTVVVVVLDGSVVDAQRIHSGGVEQQNTTSSDRSKGTNALDWLDCLTDWAGLHGKGLGVSSSMNRCIHPFQ